MMDEDALTALENDIKVNGQTHPVILWRGQIVDGRNRNAACIRAGIKPKTKSMEFADDAEAVRFIISTNIHRRHLTDEQRDQIGARLVTMQQGDPAKCGVTVTAAAAMVHSTPARIERARTIERADPKLAEQVISGEISKGKAMREIKARKETPTDHDRAADTVIDAVTEAHADGYTKRMESAWAAYWKLDETEQTAFHERQKEKRMIK
jgi:ParB-like chromosome segregation protein Spo0J